MKSHFCNKIKQLICSLSSQTTDLRPLYQQENRRHRPAHPLLPQIHSLWTEKSQRRRFTDAEGVLNSTDDCFLPQQPHFNKYTFILYSLLLSYFTVNIYYYIYMGEKIHLRQLLVGDKENKAYLKCIGIYFKCRVARKQLQQIVAA